MVELQAFLKYEKQLRNLHLQEARLARRREKEMAELRQLQQERRQAEKEVEAAQATTQPLKSAQKGFVFSNGPIEQHLDPSQSQNTAAATQSYDQESAAQATETAKQALKRRIFIGLLQTNARIEKWPAR